MIHIDIYQYLNLLLVEIPNWQQKNRSLNLMVLQYPFLILQREK